MIKSNKKVIKLEKIIVEVGSTVTKIDKIIGEEIEHLETLTLPLKKNYKKENKFLEENVKTLITKVKELKEKYEDVYVCGTSVFRTLPIEQKEEFLNRFKKETGISFDIILQERENELTVLGATKKVNQKVAVMVGGGGSTEISIYDKEIIEIANSKIGVVDVTNIFPDLSEDIATSNLEDVKKYIKERLNLPKQKADILILAGGGHEFFARYSGVRYEKNTLYEDEREQIMMDIKTRKEDTKRYYSQISLDEIRNRVEDPNWWFATRAMCAFALVVAEEIEAKYIVPTDISMVHGMI